SAGSRYSHGRHHGARGLRPGARAARAGPVWAGPVRAGPVLPGVEPVGTSAPGSEGGVVLFQLGHRLLRCGLTSDQVLQGRADRVPHGGGGPVQVGQQVSLGAHLPECGGDVGVHAVARRQFRALGASSSVRLTGMFPVSAMVSMAASLVMKSMYPAAASGCGLCAVTANGSPVAPVVDSSPSAVGGTKKPRSSPIASCRSAASQDP